MTTTEKKKQAVVLIHGVGEQIPMDTLRKFVRAMWTTDEELRRPHVPSTVWNKPDDISENFELRRLTTSQNVSGHCTDFFELYWADLMRDTRLSHIMAWAKLLILHGPGRIPASLRPLWWAVVLMLCVAGLAFAELKLGIFPEPSWFAPAMGALCTLLPVLVGGFIINNVGDAARYLHVAPKNIESRRLIREAGVSLLEKLHQSGKYSRIVLVGHSLGTVIGYDILREIWARYHNLHLKAGSPSPALEALEELARTRSGDADFVDAYQAAQGSYLEEIQAQGNPWLVTDFVTVGAPLAHASLLMARTQEEFSQKLSEREYPTCPPAFETVEGKQRFSYRPVNTWVPHHAAVFAATRCTNLYFPVKWVFWGDFIGGPVAPMLGNGVKDIPVEAPKGQRFFNHSDYWEFLKKTTITPPPSWIAAFRQALRLKL